jgi:integrase
LSLGTWGRIRRYQVGPKSWRAATNYRDYDGVTRRVERHGSTGAKAERALVEALRDRAKAAGQGEITAETPVIEVCRVWFEEFKQQGKAGATIDAYDDALRLHVLPSVGALRVRELTVGVADRFLRSVRDKKGPSAAKHAKTVLSSAMALATRHGAVDHNPMRDVSRISIERKDARSLELDEVRALRAGLRKDKKAVERDVPTLVDFMLGTGMRIGEVLAVTWEALDLEAGTVEIRATVVRKKGVGLVLQHKPKRVGVAATASATVAGAAAPNPGAHRQRMERGVPFAARQAEGPVEHERRSSGGNGPDRVRLGDESQLPKDGRDPPRRGGADGAGDRRSARAQAGEHDARHVLRPQAGEPEGRRAAPDHR